MIRVLVVDDEPQARRRIMDLLHDVSDVAVVGEGEDGQEALARIRELRPDLVFLDIRMPGLSGLELSRLIAADQPPYIVFTTAYGEHALEAFAVDAIDYLLKPFDEGRLRDAIVKARKRIASGTPTKADMEQLAQGLAELGSRLSDANSAAPERLTVKDGALIKFLSLREIAFIHADGDYLQIHMSNGQHTMIREPLRDMEQRLGGRRFFRVSRSVLLNLDFVKELKPHQSGDYEFVLQNGKRFVSGPTHRAAVRQLLTDIRKDS
ncbi:MAG: LytR/AlgR family response regulator transcription factor [Rhizomicrobium sp.]